MPTVLNDKKPKARKPHGCQTCRTTIDPGTTYRRTTYLGDDGLYEWVTCLDCDPLTNIVWDWAGRPYEGITDDEIFDWAREVERDNSEDGEAARAFLQRHRYAATTDEGGVSE